MKKNDIIITLLGSGGGVAKAILAILNHSHQYAGDPIHMPINSCTLHLIDREQKNRAYYDQILDSFRPNAFVLHQFDLDDLDRFRQHLAETGTTHVIDVSWADTVDMLDCCHEMGVAYVNTALENVMVDNNEKLEGYTLLERFRIFQEHRSRFPRMKAIIGSGMNPGVVQWMALTLMHQHPGEKPIGCYIVEQDTTFFKDRTLAQPNTIYSTWSPECFLDEAIDNYPMYVTKHIPHMMYRDVYEQEFKVTLGDKQFYGCLMPHEEILSLAQTFDMEMGFIYRVSEEMTALIRANLDRTDELWDWDLHVLNPKEAELDGEDLVGVLLVYPDHERYMYNVMRSSDIYPVFAVNATYLQVACGLYGALATLLLDDIPDGVYWVDELLLQTDSRYGEYLSTYMTTFITGENAASDGLLLDRLTSRQTDAGS
ncbi:homospermidine synthase [Paenibacillus phyllosphaerae]|uniref:Homospermidine synthase n=1 Tax=Paenibacillus phyllosphaerae TaxID=274593 RepID=A0A7W5B065_9BACL|nr:saccharopine dehydrogenase NADP-binding domain-containing protein [Paenibacillus phyllosphaerae]MBB3111684.1 homospermidine synthase [Paenibacillus phyllosphaerae]